MCPGATATDMMTETLGPPALAAGKMLEQMRAEYAATVPLGRLGTPGDIVALAAWLASDEAAFLTGAAINVTGGEQVCL